MKMMNLSLFFVLTWSVLAEAGFIKGNGGNVYRCAGKNYMELLDFTEMAHVMGWTLQVRKNHQDVSWAVQRVFERASQIDPDSSFRWKEMYRDFWSEAKLVSSILLSPIDDSKHDYVPENCDVFQAAVRRLKPLPGEARYLISEFIWNRLGAADQEGLIFHEIIYRDCGGQDSRKIRALNALLFSEDFDNMKPAVIKNYFREACHSF